ncbi:MAG: hypothetical protein IT205_01405, partial [Fimbriimonadaceae bacterium]|nr:hypothetical protein [Fimbriimonadaceae bacterium]
HSKASGKIIIRFSGDIDATAHEIGHNLDRNYGLQKDLPDGAAKVELLDFFERFGERGYDPARQGISEGIAEYIRGYLVNPAETKKLAPEFTKWFESKAAPAMPAVII